MTRTDRAEKTSLEMLAGRAAIMPGVIARELTAMCPNLYIQAESAGVGYIRVMVKRGQSHWRKNRRGERLEWVGDDQASDWIIDTIEPMDECPSETLRAQLMLLS